MSRGHGKVQRAILATLETWPGCAFRVEDLARIAYGVDAVEKRHRVAVIRALRQMTLPEGWELHKVGGTVWEHLILYRPGDESSALCFEVLPWPGEGNKPIDPARWRETFADQIAALAAAEAEQEAERQRWASLTPLQQVEERLAEAERRYEGFVAIGHLVSNTGGTTPEGANRILSDIRESGMQVEALRAERDKLRAGSNSANAPDGEDTVLAW